MKKFQTISSVGKPYGSCDRVNRGTRVEYMKGTYTFYHGTVIFYAEPTFATFSFVFNGKIHGLNLSYIKKPLTERQLIVRAGKFARQIVTDFLPE